MLVHRRLRLAFAACLTSTVLLILGSVSAPLAGLADGASAPAVAHASSAITFNNSPGTGAPPPTLGPYSMTRFSTDPQPLGNVSSVAAPGNGTVGFTPTLNHLQVGSGWATWSNGYGGDVYWTNGGNNMTISLPPGTPAFYFYAEPNPFAFFNITATTQDGTSSGAISVNGFHGASYFGFYTDGSTTLQTITVNSSADFAVGEFGITGTSKRPLIFVLGIAGSELKATTTQTRTFTNSTGGTTSTSYKAGDIAWVN